MTEKEKVLTRSEVEKIINNAIKKIDPKELRQFNNITFFDDDDVNFLNSYKLSNDEVIKITKKTKCAVNIRSANILHRLEKYFCDKIGETNRRNLTPKQRLTVFRRANREYKRKSQHYDYRQEKRLISTKEKNKHMQLINRFSYLQLLNINIFTQKKNNECTIENDKIEENATEEVYQFSTSDLIPFLSQNYFMDNQRCEEIEPTYTDFQSKTMPTSTQNILPDSTTKE